MTKAQEKRSNLGNGLTLDTLVLTMKSIPLIGWVKLAFFTTLLLVIYSSALEQLVFHEWQDEDYSYCLLVPFIVLYLLFEKRREYLRAGTILHWTGLIPLVIGVALFWVGELAGAHFFLYLSLWCVNLGLFWTQFGLQNTRRAAFAFVILLGAFPLPSFLNLKVTFLLKLVSSHLGVKLLHLWGMTAYREGNVIDLGFTQLQVVDACSGLRYIFPLMLLALLLAYYFRNHWWKRLVLFLSSIPLAIVINSARIAATGVLYKWFGAAAAEGFFHGFSGWLIFILAFPWLILEMFILKMLPPRQPRTDPGHRVRSEPSGKTETGDQGKSIEVTVGYRRLVLAMISAILISTALLPRSIDFRGQIPNRKDLGHFPLQLGEWTGSRGVMEKRFLDVLKVTDYAIISYRNTQQKEINFYVAYYEAQLKGEGIHLPDSCLPAGGWYFRQTGIRDIELPGGEKLQVNRILMEKGDVRELSYYWFPQRGRAFSSVWELRIYNVLDTVTRHRSDGALLRLITPIYGSEGVEQAENRLRKFVFLIVPLITDYVPE